MSAQIPQGQQQPINIQVNSTVEIDGQAVGNAASKYQGQDVRDLNAMGGVAPL